MSTPYSPYDQWGYTLNQATMQYEPIAAPPATPAAWYQDPVTPGQWRWWDGYYWTAHTRVVGGKRKPILPAWLSIPVLIFLPIGTIGIMIGVATSPLTTVAALFPLVTVLPAMWWLDRVEPEPLSSRVHALLWGAVVATTISGVFNSIVALAVGEVGAAVFSAPFIEELTKGAGLFWALRRAEIDGETDGIVYAGWVAVGFAVVENMMYFGMTETIGDFIVVFFLRAVLSPFAHPLFTFWTGLAIGRAKQNGKSWVSGLWGLPIAMFFHALWNGSASLGVVTGAGNEGVAGVGLLLGMMIFLGLFVTVAVLLYMKRRKEQRTFTAAIPYLSNRYGLTPRERSWYLDWRQMLAIRRSLSGQRKRDFDDVRIALARLTMLHQRPEALDRTREVVLMQQLDKARRSLARP